MAEIRFEWRGGFDNRELNTLHAEAFGYPLEQWDWWGQVQKHSLGWVTARDGEGLVGFVNVPWDGSSHAFIMDTIVALRSRHQGIGRQLVEIGAEQARAAGCWTLHVDFRKDLEPFYFQSCGFQPTIAGTMALRTE